MKQSECTMVRVLRILNIADDVSLFDNEGTDITLKKADSLSRSYVLYGQEQHRPG